MDSRLQQMLNAVPMPAEGLKLTLYTLKAGHLIHRVHHSKFGGAQFNPGPHGDARFSPICDADDKPIPTMYAATTFECAVMETAFHDVPYTSDLKTYQKSKLKHLVYSQLAVQSDLSLIDLSTLALRKLGIERNQLIDTESVTYPRTRAWAGAIYLQCPSAQGLSWISRQDDQARAFVFFESRLPATPFVATPHKSLTGDITTYSALLDLADLIGLDIIAH